MITTRNMKTPIKILTLAFFTLIAVPAYSGSIADTYTAGDTLTAAKMDSIKSAVNDNDGRVTTNEGDIATNAGDITTNAGDISTNAADIATLQAANACPSDMVAVGTFCIDKYEASVYSDAGLTPANIIPGGTINLANCDAQGNGCKAGEAGEIYAGSVAGVLPAFSMTYWQASVACANVGKRLPTVNEWQTAAIGTPDNGAGGGAACNGSTALEVTGLAGANCQSSYGAFDMVGNVYEMTSLIHFGGAVNYTNVDLADQNAVAFGDDYDSNGGAVSPSVNASWMFDATDPADTLTTGFRCAK